MKGISVIVFNDGGICINENSTAEDHAARVAFYKKQETGIFAQCFKQYEN